MADVVIIGARISGSASACELATAGLDVALMDRYATARPSGWTRASPAPAPAPAPQNCHSPAPPSRSEAYPAERPDVSPHDLLHPLGLLFPFDVKMVTVLRSVPTEPRLDHVIGVVDGESTGRQVTAGRCRYTNGTEPRHGLMEDGTQLRVCLAAHSIAHTKRHFGSLIRAIQDAPIEEIWTGLIDQSPDALPVLKVVTAREGVVVAIGFGHGRIMEAFVQGNDPDLPLDPFRIERFDGWNDIAEPITLHG
jgi:glycine/D-amino acid oxidase-like deaminating enzyme